MKISDAVEALGALAQQSRLEVYRYLVQAGPGGVAAGAIAEHFGMPGATLSFHLSALKQAHLVVCQREGRSLIYSANYQTMGELMSYLTENCCQGGV
ncbi:MAG: helix-turn-helix transcriptional regulator [Pseudomonadota bacterium]|nr:MAG: helix-turn-helix transcriptional regulator [Pseudomonadota bacterium]